MCLFVMLTNSLFNNPFYNFKDLGQGELPAPSEISLFLSGTRTSAQILSPGFSGSPGELLVR